MKIVTATQTFPFKVILSATSKFICSFDLSYVQVPAFHSEALLLIPAFIVQSHNSTSSSALKHSEHCYLSMARHVAKQPRRRKRTRYRVSTCTRLIYMASSSRKAMVGTDAVIYKIGSG